jgi:hypothetical protein
LLTVGSVSLLVCVHKLPIRLAFVGRHLIMYVCMYACLTELYYLYSALKCILLNLFFLRKELRVLYWRLMRPLTKNRKAQ